MYGIIYIVNARAHNVTRDDDYRAVAYRALNATLSCVMFRQCLDFNSENHTINTEKKLNSRVIVFRVLYLMHSMVRLRLTICY